MLVWEFLAFRWLLFICFVGLLCVVYSRLCYGCLWVGGFGSLGFHGDRLGLFVVVDLVDFRGCFVLIDLLCDCLAGFWWFGLLATRAFVSLVVVCTWCFVFGLGDSFGFCCG